MYASWATAGTVSDFRHCQVMRTLAEVSFSTHEVAVKVAAAPQFAPSQISRVKPVQT